MKKSVLFDAGGTLFDPFPSVGAVYARFANKYGMNVTPEEVQQSFALEYKTRVGIKSLISYGDESRERLWWNGYVSSVMKRITELKQFDLFFNELYDFFATADAWELYPEAVPVLQKLVGQKLTLGIISNWDSRLYAICKNLQIDQYFSFILISAVFGYSKPSPEIFLKALELAKVTAEQTLYVGDSLIFDAEGARNSGMDFLIIDRENKDIGEDVRTISSLVQIFDYL